MRIKSYFFLILLSACSSIGSMPQSNGTDVILKGNNYKIIKHGVRGESHGFYLLGIIPIVSPNYADAKASLYENANQPVEGRSIAFANYTQDKSFLYLILFSIPRITISADLVEFHSNEVDLLEN